jgi:hypothetical protein
MGGSFYCYIGLDTRKTGDWEFEGVKFKFQPFYIGKGKGRRLKGHTTAKEKSKFNIKSHIVEKIIRETGENPIFEKVYDNLTEDDAFEVERKMIKHFGRINNKTGILANLTDGGRGRVNPITTEETKVKISQVAMGKIAFNSQRVDQFDLDLNFIKKYESVGAAAIELGLSEKERNLIYQNCRGPRKSALGYIWKHDGTSAYEPPQKQRPKNIITVSKYGVDGNFIESYESVTLAAFSVSGITTGISSCCKDDGSTYKGFQWRYGDSEANIGSVIRYRSRRGSKIRPVFQYSLQGEFLQSFKSISDAARNLQINSSSIERAIYGSSLSFRGFQLFSEDMGPSVPPLIQRGYTRLEVSSYDLNGQLLEVFPDVKNAAIKEGISPYLLKKVIKLNSIFNNKTFKRGV